MQFRHHCKIKLKCSNYVNKNKTQQNKTKTNTAFELLTHPSIFILITKETDLHFYYIYLGVSDYLP